jgi:cytochrome P450
MVAQAVPARPIPRVTEPPLLGSMTAFQKDRLTLFRRVSATYGDIARMKFGPFPVIFINSPDLVQQVLVEHAQDFDNGLAIHRAFNPIIGNGLVNNEGESWRVQRKLMAPPFQHRNIARYGETMVAFTEQAQAGWADGSTIDVDHAMTALTMRIVGKTLFDDDVLSETDELGNAITVALQYMQYTLDHIFPVPLSIPTPRSRRVRRALGVIDRRLHAMIEEHRRSPDRGDLLSLLLQARYDDGSAMSDKQIRDEALTVFVAGHETTANALAWGFYLLATHPAIYAKLQEEADRVLGGRAATVADLPNLPYSLQVFKEAMRLYPPAYTIGRTALRPVDIGGYHLNKNDIIIIGSFTIQRRPEFFGPTPDAFNPDHFTPENEKRLPRYAYLPFGAGPRICIGNQFALMEGQLLLATLAQHVTFELVPGQEIVPQPVFTLRQKHGCKVIVHRRRPQS